ncbi:MAG: YbaN family protein [Spirochaetota bacterium]
MNGKTKEKQPKAVKLLLVGAGSVSVGIGVLGIFLPLLPTTPFLLVAGFCYARSSGRLHRWLLSNRVFGSYIKNYLEKREIPKGARVVVSILLWGTISYSSLVVVEHLFLKILLFAVAFGVSLHIWGKLKRKKL